MNESIDVIRDRLAQRRGWKRMGVTLFYFDHTGTCHVLQWERDERVVSDHPIPYTLDEAARLPEWWQMRWVAENAWVALRPDGKSCIVPRTDSEIDDRFRLRDLCEQADEVAAKGPR